ncbi:MAG: polyprotein [Scallop picorna-like virus 1]|nr:MAG: polyprotein [Scallop picorna-like virus 1]
MTTSEKSRAVLKMACEEIGVRTVAPKTIGLHRHTYDTASNGDRVLSVPAFDTGNATGPRCDASSLRSDLTVDNYIHIQGGSVISWTPEIDRAIAHYMSESVSRRGALPAILSNIPAFDLLRRWRELDTTNVLPPNFGASWTSGSYTDTDSSTNSSYIESHPWAFMAKDFLNGVADVVDSAPYFWTVTVFKIYMARNNPAARMLVLSDILARHVSMIRSFAEKQLPEGHATDTAMLLNEVADSLAGLTDDKVCEYGHHVPSGEVYEHQVGADFFEHFNTFSNAYAAVTAIYKYLSDRQVIYPLIKLLVAGSLFAFGTHIGDAEVFTSENIKAATNTIFGFFRTGTVGAFMQVFDSISKLLNTWIHSDGTTSLTQHLQRTNKAEHYYQLGMKLLKLQPTYAQELVTNQKAYLAEVHEFIEYCTDHLGAGIHVKDPWRAAFAIISDRNRITWFQTAWRQLDAFYTIEISRSMRMQPCVFFLEAGSSIGKTTLQRIINQMVLTEHLGVSVDQVDTFTYPWPSDEPNFANGAKNSMLTVIFDDIGAYRWDVTKSTGGDPFVKRLLGLLNMHPYGPDQAALELKGKIFLAPELVIMSTNNKGLDLNLVYKEPAAVQRRIGDVIHITVADEFAKDTMTLDDKKLNDWCVANPGKVPDAWRFRIERFQADNRDYNRSGEGIKTITTWLPPRNDPPMDTPTFLKWASDKFAAHKALHTSILDTLNVPFDFGPILRPDAVDAERHESDTSMIAEQSGADVWFFSKWSHYNSTPTINDVGANMDVSPWILLASLWAFILLCLHLPAFFGSMYRRAIDRYNNSLPMRILRGVNAGRLLVRDCQQRRRRAIEWLDNNKRTIALLTTIVGAGAIAAYAFRNRKKNRQDHQVGDENKDARGGFTVHTTSNDRISRWATLGSSIDKASMYGLSQQSLSASGTNVVAIVGENMVNITFSCSNTSPSTTYKCAGIIVGGRQLVMNRHSLPQFCKQRSTDPKWAQYTMIVHGAGYNNHNQGAGDVVVPCDQINGNYCPGRDLAGIVLPMSCRPYRNIVSYFPKVPSTLWTKDFAYTQSIMPPGTKIAFGKKVPVGVNVAPYGLVVAGEATNIQYVTSPLGQPRRITLDTPDDIEAPVMCYQVKTPEVHTYAGDCGSPYFLFERMDNIGAIGGIHLGQLIDDKTTKVVIPIYWSDIVALFSDIDAPLVAEAGPIMSDTETQSGIGNQSFATRNYVLQQGDTKLNIRLHNSPILSSDMFWPQKTIDYMREKMGVEVNPNSFAVVGYDSGGGNLASDIQKSPMYDAIFNMDPKGLPDSLRSEKQINNLTRSKRNHDAAAGIAAIMTHADYDPVLAEEFHNAAESYFESIVTFDEKGGNCIFRHIHPVDVDTAINGSHFADDGNTPINHKGMEAITMNTSPGHPWTAMFPDDVQEGIQRVGKYPWFRCTFGPDGRRHYTMGPQLLASYTELLSLFKTDHQTKVKFVTACKDEVKKESKPTRLIMVGPQCMTIVCREFLMTICRVMQLNPFVFGAVVGLDATCVQWDQVHNFICGTQGLERYTFDGDYKDFDKSLFQEVTDGVKWVILSMCKRSGHYDNEQLFVVESILCCLLSPVVDVFGVVYWFRSFNTSGNSLTTQINCIANMLFIWVVWTRRMKKDMGAGYDERLSREMFNRLVHVVTYGDDHMVGVNYPNMLNCRIMEQELSQFVTYTDAHKNTGSDIAEFTPHEELIFLGRSMVRDSTGSYRPPLEFKRLAKTCLFYRRRPGMQYEHMIPDLFRGILLEVHFHGEDVYNLFYERIVNIMCDHYSMNRSDLENTFFLDTSGELLTYDYFRQWWLEKKDKGYLQDPKYEMAVRPDFHKNRELYDRYLALKAPGGH